MPADIRTSKIEMEKEFGVVLKSVVHDARQAAEAVDAYGRAIRRVDAAHVRTNGSRRRALLSTRQLAHENRALTKTLASLQRAALRPAGTDAALTSFLISTRGDRQQSRPRTRARVERTRRPAPDLRVSEHRIDFDTLGLINSWIGALGAGAEDIARTPASRLSPIGEAVRKIPRIGTIGKALSLTTAVTGPVIIAGKHLQDGVPTEESALAGVLNAINDFITVAGSAATLASAAAPFLGPTLGGAALTLGAAAIPLTFAGPILSIGLSVGKRVYDKRQARQRELDARLAERRRDLPKETKTDLEKRARGRERRFSETYETLRMSNQSVVNLTGKDVDDLLRGLQDFDPKAVESYFQSLREGRGEIAQLSQAQLAHLDRIEQLVVTYRALAAESAGAREAASEYANQLRPVDVIFETLKVHAGELISKFVGQREELHRSTQATEAQARAATDLTAATAAQRRATEHAVKVEAAHNQNLRMTTRQNRAASAQIFHTTERLEDLTGALATTNSRLAVHDDHVTAVTAAYRELSEQVGATVGDVLSGEVSFKEAWESLGRGVLETVKNLGRQLMDSLLGGVRDLGRGLSDVIFGPFQGTRGSLGFGGSLGFLPSFLAGGSPGGFPAGFPTFPTFPTGGGFSFGGLPVGGGSQLWNAGAATIARYLPFTAPTLASYGFTVSPVGLGIGSGGVAPGLNAGALGVTPRYAAPVPGVNAPPAAGVGPFSPAALGALGGLGGSSGGTALLNALGFQPGIASTIGGFAGGIAGSLATPALTALLAPALGPLAPVLGPLFGTFFGTTLGGLFGFQPTRIDTEKRAIRAFFREDVPGYDYQRKESRNVAGLNKARAAGLDVGNAYLAASLPYVLAADNGGLGTVQRFHNIGVAGLGRSGATLQQARAAALRAAQRTGTHTTEGAITALNRSLAGGFDRKSDPFTVDEVLWGVRKNVGESRPTRDPVRLRNVVAGIIDIQTEFASFVDSSRIAAGILADETEQALRTAGRDAGDYADVLDRIRDGSTHAAEALREIGGIEFSDLTFSAEEFDSILTRIKDDVGAIQGAATTAITTGLAERQDRSTVEAAFETGLGDALRQGLIRRIVDRELGDLGSLFDDLDLTKPLEAGSDLAETIKTRVGSVYEQVVNALKAAGLWEASGVDRNDPDSIAAAETVRRTRHQQRLEAVGALAPGTAGINLLNTEIETLRRDVGALALPTADASAESLRTALGLIEQLADKTVAYYQTAIAEQQTLFAAYETTADSLDRRVQGLIGAPGGLSRTEQLASLQARAQSTREELAGLTGTDRAAALDRLGANLDAQIRLGAYASGDPRQRRLFNRNLAEIEDLREDADKHARTAEQTIEDLQGAVVSEINNLHDLSDQYFKTSIGKFSEIADLIRGYETADGLGPIDPPAPRRQPAGAPPPEAAAATSASVLPEKGGRRGSSPAVTINVTLPESAGASDEAAAYARAFVAELERQLQPGARGYELIHTISRES